MVLPIETAGPVPATLPEWLAEQALRRPAEIALRHKRLGQWHACAWARLADDTLRLAGALYTRGFGAQSQLVILSRPRPEALALALAAQWLGGVAVPLDPLAPRETLLALLASVEPTFAFAETREEVCVLDAAEVRLRLLGLGDARGVAWDAARGEQLRYEELLAYPPLPQPARSPDSRAPAFAFYRQGPEGRIQNRLLSHADLLREGRLLIEREHLGAQEDALAARAFAAAGQARYLLAPWLIAGFRLNFPESLATRDNDRRELAPTLVAGTRETYGRLFEQIQARLPPAGTPTRRLVDWALTATPGPLQRHLGDWLVRRPLRRMLGFTRTRAPLLVGEPLEPEAQRFFAGLGVAVRNWPDAGEWRVPSAALPLETPWRPQVGLQPI